MLNSEQSVQVSDTTDGDSSNESGNKIPSQSAEDWKEKVRDYVLRNPNGVPQWEDQLDFIDREVVKPLQSLHQPAQEEIKQ